MMHRLSTDAPQSFCEDDSRDHMAYDDGQVHAEISEVKKKQKRAANRKSAQLSRQRKKKYIEQLTSDYSQLKVSELFL